MDDSILAKSSLFARIPVDEITRALEGSVEAQKVFSNGSQVNVSIRMPGDVIGQPPYFLEARFTLLDSC